MNRFVATLILALAVMVSSTGGAEARIFEFQKNWWSSGALCVSTREPPARRWRTLPPRACSAPEDSTQTIALLASPQTTSSVTAPGLREDYVPCEVACQNDVGVWQVLEARFERAGLLMSFDERQSPSSGMQ